MGNCLCFRDLVKIKGKSYRIRERLGEGYVYIFLSADNICRILTYYDHET